jgi:hypothetical protein
MPRLRRWPSRNFLIALSAFGLLERGNSNHFSQLLAGTRSGPERSPGAARVPDPRDQTRGRRAPSRLNDRLAKAPFSERSAAMILGRGAAGISFLGGLNLARPRRPGRRCGVGDETLPLLERPQVHTITPLTMLDALKAIWWQNIRGRRPHSARDCRPTAPLRGARQRDRSSVWREVTFPGRTSPRSCKTLRFTIAALGSIFVLLVLYVYRA